ncbi:MAG: alpha/beta hydrolase [Methylocella sp.]
MVAIHRRAFVAASAAALTAPDLAQAQAQAEDKLGWGSMSRAARDDAYNNGAAVSDSTQIVDRWIADSAAFRAKHPGHLDLAFGPGDRTKWDLFPSDNPKAPVLVFIHGGYWQARNREHFSCFAEGLMAHGWSVAMPGYTLAPAATLTQIVAEIRSALDWLGAHGSEHGLAGPIILSGWSAGGQLAALALDHPIVRGGYAVSGIYELGPIRDTYLNEKLKLTDGEIATLSPLRLPSVNKRLAIAYGTAELPALVHNSRAFHAYRAGSHHAGALFPIPHANHYTGIGQLRLPDSIPTLTALRMMEDV